MAAPRVQFLSELEVNHDKKIYSIADVINSLLVNAGGGGGARGVRGGRPGESKQEPQKRSPPPRSDDDTTEEQIARRPKVEINPEILNTKFILAFLLRRMCEFVECLCRLGCTVPTDVPMAELLVFEYVSNQDMVQELHLNTKYRWETAVVKASAKSREELYTQLKGLIQYIRHEAGDKIERVFNPVLDNIVGQLETPAEMYSLYTYTKYLPDSFDIVQTRNVVENDYDDPPGHPDGGAESVETVHKEDDPAERRRRDKFEREYRVNHIDPTVEAIKRAYKGHKYRVALFHILEYLGLLKLCWMYIYTPDDRNTPKIATSVSEGKTEEDMSIKKLFEDEAYYTDRGAKDVCDVLLNRIYILYYIRKYKSIDSLIGKPFPYRMLRSPLKWPTNMHVCLGHTVSVYDMSSDVFNTRSDTETLNPGLRTYWSEIIRGTEDMERSEAVFATCSNLHYSSLTNDVDRLAIYLYVKLSPELTGVVNLTDNAVAINPIVSKSSDNKNVADDFFYLDLDANGIMCVLRAMIYTVITTLQKNGDVVDEQAVRNIYAIHNKMVKEPTEFKKVSEREKEILEAFLLPHYSALGVDKTLLKNFIDHLYTSGAGSEFGNSKLFTSKFMAPKLLRKKTVAGRR